MKRFAEFSEKYLGRKDVVLLIEDLEDLFSISRMQLRYLKLEAKNIIFMQGNPTSLIVSGPLLPTRWVPNPASRADFMTCPYRNQQN
jgi:hypothetical protein